MSITPTANEKMEKARQIIPTPEQRPEAKMLIDPDTQEPVFVNPAFLNYDPDEDYSNDIRKSNFIEYNKDRNEFNRTLSELGHGEKFYFLRYNQFLETIDYDYKLAFRFLYICTFADYESILKFDRTIIDKEFLRELFERTCTERQSLNIYKDLLKYGLIEETPTYDNRYVLRVTDNFFARGILSNKDKKNSVRTLSYGIRQLFEHSKPDEHSKLGRIVALLPYLNIYHNVLCENPTESTVEAIIPLSKAKIAEIVGYMNNLKYLTPFMTSIKVGDSPLMMETIHADNRRVYYVNPAVFYMGNDVTQLRNLIDIFKIGQHTQSE